MGMAGFLTLASRLSLRELLCNMRDPRPPCHACVAVFILSLRFHYLSSPTGGRRIWCLQCVCLELGSPFLPLVLLQKVFAAQYDSPNEGCKVMTHHSQLANNSTRVATLYDPRKRISIYRSADKDSTSNLQMAEQYEVVFSGNKPHQGRRPEMA